MSLLNH